MIRPGYEWTAPSRICWWDWSCPLPGPPAPAHWQCPCCYCSAVLSSVTHPSVSPRLSSALSHCYLPSTALHPVTTPAHQSVSSSNNIDTESNTTNTTTLIIITGGRTIRSSCDNLVNINEQLRRVLWCIILIYKARLCVCLFVLLLSQMCYFLSILLIILCYLNDIFAL